MTNSAPKLFDPSALNRHRARSADAPADFLVREASFVIQERLEEVNRSFTNPALIGHWAPLWQEQLGMGGKLTPEAEVLDLQEGAHDLVLSAMHLHWANDPVGQLVQMRRALKPDGLMLAALFGGQTLHQLRACLAEAETELEGGLSPRVSPMGDVRDLGALLQRAGFALPVADAITLTVTYESALHLMRDLRAMGETNALQNRRKSLSRRATLMRAASLYHDHFASPDGRIPATFEIVYLTGWAPAPTQQQPLRPGSAQARLADALGTFEIPAGEKPDSGR